MKKTYLNLEGCTSEDVKRELSYLFIEMKRLGRLKKDSFEYVAISYDIKDRMTAFKNYFSQDVDIIMNNIGISLDNV